MARADGHNGVVVRVYRVGVAVALDARHRVDDPVRRLHCRVRVERGWDEPGEVLGGEFALGDAVCRGRPRTAPLEVRCVIPADDAPGSVHPSEPEPSGREVLDGDMAAHVVREHPRAGVRVIRGEPEVLRVQRVVVRPAAPRLDDDRAPVVVVPPVLERECGRPVEDARDVARIPPVGRKSLAREVVDVAIRRSRARGCVRRDVVHPGVDLELADGPHGVAVVGPGRVGGVEVVLAPRREGVGRSVGRGDHLRYPEPEVPEIRLEPPEVRLPGRVGRLDPVPERSRCRVGRLPPRRVVPAKRRLLCRGIARG